ncbi:MAG TPA: hypothetical protein PLV72_01025 [Candidatus Magasanikbacteria bacterium]|nr:hypothetical protein [Candidatus Magasanikbacteria bacterium]
MTLSPLQKYILVRCLERNTKVDRKVFCAFYANREKKPKEKYLQNVITNSLESLIDREYLVGYGKRTPHKWFMTHVELTARGFDAAEEVLREKQNKLPLR